MPKRRMSSWDQILRHPREAFCDGLDKAGDMPLTGFSKGKNTFGVIFAAVTSAAVGGKPIRR